MTAPVISAGDLVAKLQEPHSLADHWSGETERRCKEAAARIQELEAALKPFAEWPMADGERDSDVYLGSTRGNVTYGDFRRARSSLNQDGGKP